MSPVLASTGPSETEEYIQWSLRNQLRKGLLQESQIIDLPCLFCELPRVTLSELCCDQVGCALLLTCPKCCQSSAWFLVSECGRIQGWFMFGECKSPSTSLPDAYPEAIQKLDRLKFQRVPGYSSIRTPVISGMSFFSDSRLSRLMGACLAQWRDSAFACFWVQDALVQNMQTFPYQGNLGRVCPIYQGAVFLFRKEVLLSPAKRSCPFLLVSLLEYGLHRFGNQTLWIDHPRWVVFTSDGPNAYVAELCLGEGQLKPYGDDPFFLRLIQLGLNLDWFGLGEHSLKMGMEPIGGYFTPNWIGKPCPTT